MAVININRNNIPLKAYLRADPNSQHFKFSDNSEEFVTHDMFWETPGGIYLDYSNVSNRNIQISEGISANARRQTLHNSECDEWFEDHIYRPRESKLFIIEGYAGCGKTTFINHLIKNYQSPEHCIHIDVGEKWSYPKEPFMFFDESLNAFDRFVDRISTKSMRLQQLIWEKFFELGCDPDEKLGAEITNTVLALKSYIDNPKSQSDLKSDLHKYLYEHYSNRGIINSPATERAKSIWHSVGQTQIIIMLIILLKCAEFFADSNNNSQAQKFSLIYDNLDIITNPAIPAENVLLLWDIMDRYIKFKTAYQIRTNSDLPDLLILITVRKVLFTHITSHLPHLEMSLSYDMSCATTCDISNLYSSQDILAHRISYWSNYTEDSVTIEKFSQIKELISIQGNEPPFSEDDDDSEYRPKNCINLDAFVNHNYRAFSNALSALLDSPKYTKLLMRDYKLKSTARWQKVATLIFSLSLLYRSGSVWNTMGFGCNDFNLIDYPTTLSRLILNYLYAAKQGHNLYQYATDRHDMLTSPNVPLTDIIDVLAKVNFLPVEMDLIGDELLKKYRLSPVVTEDLILERLADMCARTFRTSPSAYGYDAEDDELWRRPLYFTGGLKLNHTAASHEELKRYFRKSIDSDTADQIMFSITDEGFILINDIVANFEFYSARYCNINEAKPLHQAISETELNSLIQPVYDAVQRCCDRNIFFKDQYLEQYQTDLDQYLQKAFHPRTRPRFEKVAFPRKRLTSSSFRPQLHIVRVIYTHIGYFNMVKNLFASSNEKVAMCKCLTTWIEAYLTLYKKCFYDLLKGTVCNSDNNVYNSLHFLKNEQLKQYRSEGDGKNIDIGKKQTIHRKKAGRF